MEKEFFDRCVKAIAESDVLPAEDVERFNTVEKAERVSVCDDLGLCSAELLNLVFYIEEEFGETVVIDGYTPSMTIYELFELAHRALENHPNLQTAN